MSFFPFLAPLGVLLAWNRRRLTWINRTRNSLPRIDPVGVDRSFDQGCGPAVRGGRDRDGCDGRRLGSGLGWIARRDGRWNRAGVRDRRLLHVHEDGRDHEEQDGGQRSRTSLDVSCFFFALDSAHQRTLTVASVLFRFKLFMDMYNKGGIRGINKGVNAVALRQMTNWGSR